MIQFNINPTIKGYITASDLLNHEGTFHFAAFKDSFKNNGLMFSLIDDSTLNKFIFSLSIQNTSIVLEKNEVESIFTLHEIPDDVVPLRIYIMWTYTELTILCKYGLNDDEKKIVVKTNPITPPNSLIKWARKSNLLPTEEYNTEEEFRNKIHSCLQSIQDKINESGSYSQFWNISYEGQKIKSRYPKNEIEVQPIIHSLLSDQFLMSSIEIIPEYKSGVGDLDFLFISKIKGNGFAYFCVEFKNAHSEKLEAGLQTQLPCYMENKNSRYGAYCVLDYRGEYFDKPKLKDDSDLAFHLNLKRLESNDPYLDNIRIFVYNLSKPKSASRK